MATGNTCCLIFSKQVGQLAFCCQIFRKQSLLFQKTNKIICFKLKKTILKMTRFLCAGDPSIQQYSDMASDLEQQELEVHLKKKYIFYSL